MTPRRVLIGTNNLHKAAEVGKILADYTIVIPKALGITLEVEETGSTFAENAILKARAFCDASGMITIADDSGLEVDALDGAPGVHSHRYSPDPNATDADRRAWLIHNLQGKEIPWTARFRCAVAICFPENPAAEVVYGTLEGEVIDQDRGNGGFGYDAIFLVPERGLTLAEMSDEQKNEISHRGRAIEKIRSILRAYFKD